jgi:hypothetical protein
VWIRRHALASCAVVLDATPEQEAASLVEPVWALRRQWLLWALLGERFTTADAARFARKLV